MAAQAVDAMGSLVMASVPLALGSLSPPTIDASSLTMSAPGHTSDIAMTAAVASAAASGGSNAMTMRYTSLVGVSGAIQTKNMSSSFMKEDGNAWWDRRLADTRAVLDDLRARKRMRFSEAAAEDVTELTDSKASYPPKHDLQQDSMTPAFPPAKSKLNPDNV